ncbi:V-type ATPase subunit, partial [Candidatus Micrarchaeota archaeon]|nr:V-type ATPase subunit [Candidatus Micrarchaeota archaeon]
MVDSSFGYANARIKAMKAKLFDVDKMRELSAVKTLPEVIELLEESVYKKEFVDASVKHS